MIDFIPFMRMLAERRITCSEADKMLDVATGTCAAIKRKVRYPNVKFVGKVCDVFGCQIEDVIRITPPPSEKSPSSVPDCLF